MFLKQIEEIKEKATGFDMMIEKKEEEIKELRKERNLVNSALRRMEVLQERLEEVGEEVEE